jgi:hypothetical protein
MARKINLGKFYFIFENKIDKTQTFLDNSVQRKDLKERLQKFVIV